MSFLPCSQLMAQARVTVTNPSSLQRQELVAIDAQQVYDLVGISQGEPFVVSQVVDKNPTEVTSCAKSISRSPPTASC